MSGFLLDTNCISELVQPKPDRGVLAWMEAAEESVLFLSVLTIGEIRKGTANLAHGRRKTRLEAWLEVDLQVRFSGRILPIEAAIADLWGRLGAEANRKGKVLPAIDGLLAATALHHNLTIVSRNANDFAVTRAAILNPWET